MSYSLSLASMLSISQDSVKWSLHHNLKVTRDQKSRKEKLQQLQDHLLLKDDLVMISLEKNSKR